MVVVVVVVRPSAGMRKAGEWVRTEMTATERPGSVSGGLCENAMGEGGQGWWWWWCGCPVACDKGVGLCQNSQNRAGVLGFGHAVQNGSGSGWAGVV